MYYETVSIRGMAWVKLSLLECYNTHRTRKANELLCEGTYSNLKNMPSFHECIIVYVILNIHKFNPLKPDGIPVISKFYTGQKSPSRGHDETGIGHNG